MADTNNTGKTSKKKPHNGNGIFKPITAEAAAKKLAEIGKKNDGLRAEAIAMGIPVTTRVK